MVENPEGIFPTPLKTSSQQKQNSPYCVGRRAAQRLHKTTSHEAGVFQDGFVLLKISLAIAHCFQATGPHGCRADNASTARAGSTVPILGEDNFHT